MPNKIKLILNPTTNHGRSQRVAADLRPLMEEHKAEWSGTEYPGHATQLARQAGEEGFDLVVAAGGDGTVHEVINGLMQVPEKKRPALGIVPLGSGNDFAHILGIPEDPATALLSCLRGGPHSLDMGSVTDQNGRVEYFNNTLGIGFDAVVTIRTRKITAIHGFMMYFVATVQTVILNFTPMDLHVETDRESWDQATIMLTVGNGPREGGGFMVTPQARLDDGVLEFVSVKKISRPMMFRLIPEFMKGTHTHFKPIKMGQCRRMAVTSRQPLYVHADGEVYSGFGTDVRQLSIEILPNALRFLKE
ncbi:MAG TPA: diacylglycerol kinase family protein [Anaerolineales bacterium]|nr:diacylglycerol kinase family protein [Anaerolineales bacterium]